MSATDEIQKTIERYLELMNAGKADAIVDELYAEDATLEDPVGAPPLRGREALRGFYRKSAGAVRLELSGPVRTANGEAAFPMLGTLGTRDAPSYIDIIDVMTIGADGRITSMRAFWTPGLVRKG